MTPDTATFTGLLEVCHANGLPTHGWVLGNYGWKKPDTSGCHTLANHANTTDLAALCFEVARWLSKKGYVCVRDDFLGYWIYYPHGNAEGTVLDCADNEPAALLAACKEVGK